jgi:hypothetical protein
VSESGAEIDLPTVLDSTALKNEQTTPTARKYTFYGLTLNNYYKFYVRAYRVVSPTIYNSAEGVGTDNVRFAPYVVTSLVDFSDTWFQPSLVANYIGLLNDIPIETILDDVSDTKYDILAITNDSIIESSEKKTLQDMLSELTRDRAILEGAALDYQVSDNVFSTSAQLLINLLTVSKYSIADKKNLPPANKKSVLLGDSKIEYNDAGTQLQALSTKEARNKKSYLTAGEKTALDLAVDDYFNKKKALEGALRVSSSKLIPGGALV